MQWYGYNAVHGPWNAIGTYKIGKVIHDGQVLEILITDLDDIAIGIFHFESAWAQKYCTDIYAQLSSNNIHFPAEIPHPHLYTGYTEGPLRAHSSIHPFPLITGPMVDYMLVTNGGHINVAAMAPPTFEFIGKRKDASKAIKGIESA